MPSGQLLIDRLSQAWDNDDAVFPLDQRLPAPARKQILDIVQPTIMATLAGDERVPGRPVETGDAVVVATSGTFLCETNGWRACQRRTLEGSPLLRVLSLWEPLSSRFLLSPQRRTRQLRVTARLLSLS